MTLTIRGLIVLGMGLLFGLAAWGGIALTAGLDRIALIWFSNGIMVGALLLAQRDRLLWFGLLAAGFLANLILNFLLGDPFITAFGIAIANSLEIGIAAYALRGRLTASADLLQFKVVLRFFAIAMLVAPCISAIVAACALHIGSGASILNVIQLWVPADALGMGVMVPFVFALRARELSHIAHSEAVSRLIVPIALLLLITVGVFTQSRYPLLFLLLPPILFVVFRMGFNGAALAISVVAAVAITATVHGVGPFMLVDGASMAERVFTMQLLLASLIVTTYPICAMLATQRKLVADAAKHVNELSFSQATVSALNARMQLAAGAADIGFYTWDFKTNVIEWDAQIFKMFHIDPESGPPTYEAWRARVHPLDLERSEQAINTAVANGTHLEMEFRMVWPDGTERDVRCRGVILRDRDGTAEKLIGLNMDITDIRRLDRMKSEFVAIVSHELRTPLTSIRGAIGLLASGSVPEKKIPELVQLAGRNAERLAIIIDDILDMEKIESGKMRFDMQRCSLAEIMNQAIAANTTYSARHQVRLVLRNDVPNVYVCIDTNRFLQVMANLLSNAAKFSPAGAKIDISVVEQFHSVRIAVRDYGPGIPLDFQGKVFGKFLQGDSTDSRQKGGSGLGLAISKALVEQMHGSISFITGAGLGTTFFVDLPMVAPSDDALTESNTFVSPISI